MTDTHKILTELAKEIWENADTHHLFCSVKYSEINTAVANAKKQIEAQEREQLKKLREALDEVNQALDDAIHGFNTDNTMEQHEGTLQMGIAAHKELEAD